MRSAPLAGGDFGAPFVEIDAAIGDQLVDLTLEEVVGAGDDLLLDGDALLRLEFVDELLHRGRRGDPVLVAMDDESRRGAGRQERKVVEIFRRGHGNEAFHLRPAHQQLHADPGAEREAGDPAAAAFAVERLQPVEGRGRIRQFADAVVEHALRAANAARVEAQDSKAALRLIEPQGYLDFLALEDGARFVLTDSGGIQEETTALGVPCLTLRDNTERPVTITEGTNQLVGSDPEKILPAVRALLGGPPREGRVPALWDGYAAERIADELIRFCAARAR